MLQSDLSLKAYNTFGIAAKAKSFAVVNSIEDLRQYLPTESPLLLLGGGSNILLTKDWEGLVLLNRLMGKTLLRREGSRVYVKAGAGENWHEWVLWTLSQNYFGLENLSLIPGCVGASPIQNIGAYGVELKDVFHELEAFNLISGEVRTFSKADCEFGYRDSVFKRQEKGQWCITSVTFVLSTVPQVNINYGDIKQTLSDMCVEDFTPQAVSEAIIRIRSSKLPNPAEIGNAGSFFKNPEISTTQYEDLKASFPDMPGYPSPKAGQTKVAAGYLIERTGWKGFRKGDMGVHERQALVLVNYGSAQGAELIALAQEIQASVLAKFGIALEMEVNIV